ncbi:C25 family cysteine peptidase [Bacteroidales bacterium OttesenSCG-928-J16]|nr:C25 family cysteine peptidase [Bacteroidales bacterium OttesenSCG-928-J16]
MTYSDLQDKNGRDGISIHLDVESYRITPLACKGEEMHEVSLAGIFLPNDEGAPNLPWMSRIVAMPQGAEVKVSIKNMETETLQNINIAPALRIQAIPEEPRTDYVKNKEIYEADEFYPKSIYTVSEIFEIRGVQAVTIGITPFQFNPITKELVVIRNIELEIEFIGGTKNYGDAKYRSPWFDPILRNNLLNYDQIPEMEYSGQSSRNGTGCEYLIIIPNRNDFKQYAEQIKDFRTKQGIYTKIVRLDEMGAANSAQIKAYIHNAYNTWDIPPVAVLLMGDHSNNLNIGIPAAIVHHPAGDLETNPYMDIAENDLSDTIFGSMAAKNAYPSNCISDNPYADVTGNNLPDMIFGRMAAETAADMAVLVSKFIEYETQPCMEQNYYKKPITAIGWETYRWFQICAESVGGYWRNQGKTPVRINDIYQAPQNTTIWSSESSGGTSAVINYFGPNGVGYIPATPAELGGWSGGTAAQIVTAVNNGAFALLHRDHGSDTSWSVPAFGTSHISRLANAGKMTYIFTINCQTGKFDHNPPCFGEVFHRHTHQGENAGCVGFLGPTEISYSYLNDILTWGMYDLFDPNFLPTYGPSYGNNTGSYIGYSGNWMPAFGNVSGKYFLHASGWPSDGKFKIVTYNMFTAHSDVFLRLFTEVPQPIQASHAATVVFGDSDFSITAPEGTLIALTVDGEILDVATATGSLQTMAIPSTLPIGTDIYVVCTGQNYLRYEAVVPVICYTGLPTVQGVITQNTAWNADVQAINNITVSNGATLTITATVKCNPNVSITIQPGGKLVVNGGTLTNACEPQMWQGIIVLGNKNEQQLAQYQGMLEIKNEGTIENALCAVRVASISSDRHSTGGIIKASNTTFRNNLQAVTYWSYENYNESGTIIDNVGKFTNCTFLIDSNNLFAVNGKNFQYHITMWGVRGITFAGCLFDNTTSNGGGMGIYTEDAGFKVINNCPRNMVSSGDDCACPPSLTQPTIFKNQGYGIASYNTGNPHHIHIDQSTFQDVFVGVFLSVQDNYRLTRCNFSNVENCGHQSYHSSGYRIEENTFSASHSSSNPSAYPWGIYMSNSGSANNAIYKNYFFDLQRGIVTSASNSNSPSDGSGSTVRGTAPDPLTQAPQGLQIRCNEFNNNNASIYLSSGSTICSVQGGLLKGADNTFSGKQDNSIYMANTQKVTYYHSTGGAYLPYNPVLSIGSSINGNAAANDCASTFCTPMIPDPNKSAEPDIEKYKILQEEYDYLAAEFEKNEYGYVLAKPDKYPKEVVTAAMACLAKLQELNEAMYVLSMEAVHTILEDSILYTKQLTAWYEVIRTPVAKYLLAEAYASTKDYEKADAVLKNMPELFKFEETEMKEHENYLKFFNFKKEMTLSGRNWPDLKEEEIAALENIVQTTCGRSATMARGVLCFFFEKCDENEDCRPKEEMNPKIAEAKISEFFSQEQNRNYELTIYPNPMQSELIISVNNSTVKIKQVEIYDMIGRKVFQQTMNQSYGTIQLNELFRGIYILKARLDQGDLIIRKISKQ